jgi:hypothetical protein
MDDPQERLDASLRDFETPASPTSTTRNSSILHSEPAIEDDLLADLDVASVGSYSPPAWRRLANGSRSNGFWRPPSHDALSAMSPMRLAMRNTPYSERDDDDDTDDDLDLEDNQNDILQRAIRTRLPTGSMSPDKVRSRSPDGNRSNTLRLEAPTPPVLERILESPPPTDNCKLPSLLPASAWARGHPRRFIGHWRLTYPLFCLVSV